MKPLQGSFFDGSRRQTTTESLGPPLKTCRSCGAQKPLDAFGKASREPDSLRPECKACGAAAYQAAYQAAWTRSVRGSRLTTVATLRSGAQPSAPTTRRTQPPSRSRSLPARRGWNEEQRALRRRRGWEHLGTDKDAANAKARIYNDPEGCTAPCRTSWTCSWPTASAAWR